MASDEYRVIVEKPFDPETTKQPCGPRWGGDVYVLTAEHLAALKAGKAMALDVMNEYLTFVVLEKPENMETVQPEGQRTVIRQVERVNSTHATRFRQWATRVLREYLVQGYTFNQQQLAERGLVWYLRLNETLLARPVEQLINDNTLVALVRLIEQFLLLRDTAQKEPE